VLYLDDSVDRDPITLSTIALALVVAIAERSAASRAAAVGLVSYVVYIVSIGGDFMTGRFLAVPLYLAILIIGQLATTSGAVWVPASVVLVLVGSAAPHKPLWSDSRFGDIGQKPSGIVNERAVYFREKSLVLARRGTFQDRQWPNARRNLGRMRVLETCGLMGTAGLEFGPYAYLMDVCGLADPLMARLPAVYNPEWRTGHYRRMIPAGYRESLEQSANLVQDPGLHEFYGRLRVITRTSSLLSANRIKAIAGMNTGAYDRLINQAYYRHSGSLVSIDDVGTVRADETPGNAPGNRVLTGPLAVTCPDRAGREYLDISLDSDDRYLLTFMKGPSVLASVELGPIPEHRRRPGLTGYAVDIPPRPNTEGFDTIVVAPVNGDNHYALGHLLLEGSSRNDEEIRRRVAQRDSDHRRKEERE
jgi:arabinofuranosyltransferase